MYIIKPILGILLAISPLLLPSALVYIKIKHAKQSFSPPDTRHPLDQDGF